MKKLKKETAWRNKLTYFCAVSFFIFIFPYLLCLFLYGLKYREGSKQHYEGTLVTVHSSAGVEQLPMTEYLVGAIASVVPIEYEDETIKAMSIVIRTNTLRKMNRGVSIDTSDYLDFTTQREIWGEAYEENYRRLSGLIEMTQRMVITYEGELITAPFFYVSAGKTRDGSELDGSKYPYLKSVVCSEDVLSQEYLNEVSFSIYELGKDVAIEEVDSDGYVKFIITKNTRYTGDSFREKFDILSPNFVLRKEGIKYVITSKGIGHGFGFSCYGANEMAKKGNSYDFLLCYYYQGIVLEKN